MFVIITVFLFVTLRFFCINGFMLGGWNQRSIAITRSRTQSIISATSLGIRSSLGMDLDLGDILNPSNKIWEVDNPPNQDKTNHGSQTRLEIPTRFDTCFMLVSGVIGVEPKEIFFKNGNYLHTFPIAVIGHFAPAHEGERFKPTETMWLPSEMWNGVARSYNKVIKKGYSIRAVGHLISSKWVDKNTGEDRKQFRFRITKLLRDEEFQAITSSTEHAVDTVPFIDEFHTGDSEYFDSTSSVQNLPSVAGTGES